jgi:hypothetical protein
VGGGLLSGGRIVQDWTAGYAASPNRFTGRFEVARFIETRRLPQHIAFDQVARQGHFVEIFEERRSGHNVQDNDLRLE